MTAKGVPSQFTDHPVILMQIVAAVRQNNVRYECFLQLLEFTFDLRLLRREKAVAVLTDHHFLFLRGRQEQARRPRCLFLSNRSRTEHPPLTFDFRMLAREAHNRSSTTNLNIVAV